MCCAQLFESNWNRVAAPTKTVGGAFEIELLLLKHATTAAREQRLLAMLTVQLDSQRAFAWRVETTLTTRMSA